MPTSTRAGTFAATLQDVARAAGVSLATASRVLNGSTRKVAATYRERVEGAAAELGYTANLSAQTTARGTSAIIGLLVADIVDPYFAQIAVGVARGADEAGMIVTVAITERDPAREARLVRALRGQRPRGLILAASRTAESFDPAVQAELDALASTGGRVVALGRGAGSVRSVIIDDTSGACALGLALGQGGYRDAIVLAAGEGVLTSDDRTAGFIEGFAAAGGSVSRVYRGGFTRESGSQLMTQALEGGVGTGTLVFAISDVVAVGAMSAIREAGRVVGSDIALCGFDDIPAGRDVTPGLTTVHVPLEEFGYRALRAAVDDEWDAEPGPLELEVVLRDSTPLESTRQSTAMGSLSLESKERDDRDRSVESRAHPHRTYGPGTMTTPCSSTLTPGLCSVTFRALSVEDVARRAAGAGLDSVEWGTDIHVPLDDAVAQQRVQALSANGGPAVASLGTYYRADGNGLEDPLAVIVAAKRAGAPRVRVWAGSTGSAAATRETRDTVVGRLRDLAAAAADIHPELIVGIELHDGTLADTEVAAARLLDDVDSAHVGSYWQPRIAVPDEVALDGLRLLADRVVAVHAFSWWPARERLPLRARRALWREVFALLRHLSRPMDVLLEFVPDDDPRVLPREAATLRHLIEEAG